MTELAIGFNILAIIMMVYGIIRLCNPSSPDRSNFVCFFLLVMAFASIITSGMIHLAEMRLLPVFFKAFAPFANVAFVFFFLFFVASCRYTLQIKKLQARIAWFEKASEKAKKTGLSDKAAAISPGLEIAPIEQKSLINKHEPFVDAAKKVKDSPDSENGVFMVEKSRKATFQLGCFDLRTAVNEALEGARLSFPGKIQIVIDLPREPLVFKGDMGQIELIVANLCLNSGEAMPDGGKLTLKLETLLHNGISADGFDGLPAGEYGLITVSDTGRGIPDELQSRVFEPFFTTKEEGSGAGMGLATVMQVTRKYHGAASFTSKSGRGSTFRIALPLQAVG
jgi:hypothetical protein